MDRSSSEPHAGPVPITVADVVALPVVAAARPEVVAGDDLDQRAVRWVHTSEIYEIGPLLKGGEVLLTTGLGLVGAGPARLRAYVADLADRGLAALFVELGRTFPTLPPELAEAARERGLALVALHEVVPFVDVTETVHLALLAQEVSGLRRLEHVNAELTSCLLGGGGLPALMRCVAGLADGPAAVLSADGRVAASSEPLPDEAWSAGPRAAVEVFGFEWGYLAVHRSFTPDLDPILERSAAAVALELVRSGSAAPARFGAGRALVLDLVENHVRSAAEAHTRAEAVGVAPRPGHVLLAACVRFNRGISTRAALNAVTEAARQVLGSACVADLHADVLLIGRMAEVDEAALRRTARRLLTIVDTELAATGTGRALVMTAGRPVSSVLALGQELAAARESADLGLRLGGGARLLLSGDLGVHRLLARLVEDPMLEQFVDEHLGPLLEHDARRRTSLVPTLDAYLSSGLAKTRTAAALGVRRQTLYGRLDRITALLGSTALADPGRRTALQLALIAWRLRSRVG